VEPRGVQKPAGKKKENLFKEMVQIRCYLKEFPKN
jgi:hypothetical protein